MSQHLETFPGHLNGQYPYESLPRNAIRILTILPGLQGDVVRCTISHARLKTGDSDVAPQYTALSYVWGDPRVREEILVDGFKVSVTENLYLALRHLQHKSATRRVWADALCINQGDLAEKRYQIELMKYIYMLADEVVMWVGTSGHQQGYKAMKFLIELERQQNQDQTSAFIAPDVIRTLFGLQDNYRKQEQAHAIRLLFERPYWFRVWVLQECILAQKAVVMCGEYRLTWEFLRSILWYWKKKIAQRNAHGLAGTSLFNDAVMLLGDLAVKSAYGTPIDLMEALVLSRERDCTNSLDKVFGVLGFVTDRSVLLDVDYQRHIVTVFRRVAYHFIEERRSLDYLTACKPTRNKDPLELPSWIPDWTEPLEEMATLSYLLFSYPKPKFYRAAQATVPLVRYLDEGKRICVTGSVFDKVALTWEHSLLWNFEEIKNNSERYLSAKGADSPYGDDEGVVRALRSAAILGRDVKGMEETFTDEKFHSWFWPFVMGDNTPFEVESEDPELRRRYRGWFHTLSTCLFYPGQFFITERGYIGRGPTDMTCGDEVCILYGARVPFILCRCEEEWRNAKQYELLGECYVQGIMKGEALDHPECQVEGLILC